MYIEDFPEEAERLSELCMKIRSSKGLDRQSPIVKEYNSIIESLLDRGLEDGIDIMGMAIGQTLMSKRYNLFEQQLLEEGRQRRLERLRQMGKTEAEGDEDQKKIQPNWR